MRGGVELTGEGDPVDVSQLHLKSGWKHERRRRDTSDLGGSAITFPRALKSTF